MSVRGSRRRMLSREERVLWRTVTQSIVPLRDAPEAMAEDVADIAAATPRSSRLARPDARKPALPSAPVPQTTAPLTPLGRRLRQRVARGRESIEARLDLHGMTQSEAHAALAHFLHTARARGLRLVLVITGKGRRNEGETGVLRRQVPHWLAMPEFRSVVIGFEDAHISHGGEGALYVRLRRPRDR